MLRFLWRLAISAVSSLRGIWVIFEGEAKLDWRRGLLEGRRRGIVCGWNGGGGSGEMKRGPGRGGGASRCWMGDLI